MEKKERKWQGMNWCRPSTRLAIYLRDGLACAWCGFALEDGAQLSLDHCKPHSKGGDNDPGNLVTACKKCNSSRQDRPMKQFAEAVAAYTAKDAKAIMNHVNNCRKRQLPRDEAREMLRRRGTLSVVLNGDDSEE